MNVPLLDTNEQHFHIPGPLASMRLFLGYMSAVQPREGPKRIVLYVHGATFPSALSIAHRFDGRSWRDELDEAGFDVWALDFYGFGLSDRLRDARASGSAAVLPRCSIVANLDQGSFIVSWRRKS